MRLAARSYRKNLIKWGKVAFHLSFPLATLVFSPSVATLLFFLFYNAASYYIYVEERKMENLAYWYLLQWYVFLFFVLVVREKMWG